MTSHLGNTARLSSRSLRGTAGMHDDEGAGGSAAHELVLSLRGYLQSRQSAITGVSVPDSLVPPDAVMCWSTPAKWRRWIMTQQNHLGTEGKAWLKIKRRVSDSHKRKRINILLGKNKSVLNLQYKSISRLRHLRMLLPYISAAHVSVRVHVLTELTLIQLHCWDSFRGQRDMG